MYHRPRSYLLFLNVILVWHVTALGTLSNASEFTITEVAPGIYVHQGIHVGLDNPRRDDIANIGFIVGSRCVAVIDTGGSIAMGRKLNAAITKITPLPVCYVINTHVHFDHVLGNYAFKAAKPHFVGHHQLLQAMEANRSFFAESFACELGSETSGNRVIAPDTLVKNKLDIDLGNRTLVLTAHPTAHTTQDLTVWDKQTNTLWLSDLLFTERIPVIDGSLTGWLELINNLAKLSVDQVIPGHGPVLAKWPESANDQLRYFHTLLKDIRKSIGAGVFLEDAIKSAGQSEKNHWLLFDQHHKRNVGRAFAELEWE